MNLKDTTSEYIIIKAYSRNKKVSCEYVLIENVSAFVETLRQGAEAIKLLKRKNINFSNISFGEDCDNITFCQGEKVADRSLLKDREKKFTTLKEERWVYLSLSDEEIKKLNPTSIEMYLNIHIVVLQEGFFCIEAQGEESEDVFLTETYHIDGFLSNISLMKKYKNKQTV